MAEGTLMDRYYDGLRARSGILDSQYNTTHDIGGGMSVTYHKRGMTLSRPTCGNGSHVRFAWGDSPLPDRCDCGAVVEPSGRSPGDQP